MLARFTSSAGCGCKRITNISLRLLTTTYVRSTTYQQDQNTTEGCRKSLNIAVIGQPNVGKSSLVNRLVGERVSVVLSRSHTTRRSTRGILNVGNTQLVFTDTPGTVSYKEARRLSMHKDHIRAPLRVSGGADIIAVLVDANNRHTRSYIHDNILNILRAHPQIPSILVMNKVDMVDKHHLVALAQNLMQKKTTDERGIPVGGWDRFDEVHYVSAVHGQGVPILVDYLVSRARDCEWEFDSDVYTDADVEFAISEVFREKLMTLIGEEIPWQVKQETLIFTPDEHTSTLRIVQQLTWPRPSQQRYVLEKKKQLREQCTKLLENMFQCDVELELIISQKNNMRKDDVHYS